jgi:hypothetical protein
MGGSKADVRKETKVQKHLHRTKPVNDRQRSGWPRQPPRHSRERRLHQRKRGGEPDGHSNRRLVVWRGEKIG